jgi:hypothetical protein
MTVGDIEQHLGVTGLVDALLDLTRKEKVYRGLSAEVLRHSAASPFMALRIRRPVFQSDTDLENHIIRCTAGENFRNRPPRADFVIYQLANGTRTLNLPIMGNQSVGRVLCFFQVHFPSPPSERLSAGSVGRFAAIRPMVQLPLSSSQIARGMPRFEWATGKEIMVIRIGSINQAASMVPVLPSLQTATAAKEPSEVWSKATSYILNTKVDLMTFATYY